MPIAGESLLSRESYLDDDFKDDSKDNKTIWERCCGPIRAGSLRGAVLSLASLWLYFSNWANQPRTNP